METAEWLYVYEDGGGLFICDQTPKWDNNKHGFFAAGKRCVGVLHVDTRGKVDWTVDDEGMIRAVQLALAMGMVELKEGGKK